MKTTRFFALFLALSLWMTTMVSATGNDSPILPEDPDILAKAALLVDAHTGKVVYAKNEHQELYPASLTKVMTALLVLDAVEDGKLSMDQPITASASAVSGLPNDSSTANIKQGETMPVRDLLYCLLVVSANEASQILAEAVSGSVEDFVDAMNTKAAALGCENTHFVNPHGLHDPQHYTSAWDMYLITAAAMEHPMFMTICDTAHAIIPATNMSKERDYWTTNHLLSTWRVIGYRNSEAHGIKTGHTDDAGYCLISSAARGSLSFISVILGAERVESNGVGNLRSFSETTRMFNYGFDNFGYQTILETKDPVQEIPVTLSETEFVTVYPANEVTALLPNTLSPEDLDRAFVLQSPVEAPISRGQTLGHMELSYHNVIYGSVPLLAGFDVEASRLQVFLRDLQEFFAQPTVRIAAVLLLALLILLLLFLLWRRIFGRRRYRYGRSVRRGRGSNYRGRRR